METINADDEELPIVILKERIALKCGLRHSIFSSTGNEYTGEWWNDKKHGTGTQVWKKSGAVYDGEWKYGKYDGYGTYDIYVSEISRYIRKYDGEWKNGKKHGHGTYYYDDSSVYVGEWIEGQRSGWGRVTYGSGEVYEGEWLSDKRAGSGVFKYGNGNWYDGTWKDGKKHGNGRFYYKDKKILYEGYWVNDEAKCGTLTECRDVEPPEPSQYIFPKLELVNSDLVLKEAKAVHLPET